MVQRLANTPASGVGGGLAVAAKIMAKYGYKVRRKKLKLSSINLDLANIDLVKNPSI